MGARKHSQSRSADRLSVSGAVSKARRKPLSLPSLSQPPGDQSLLLALPGRGLSTPRSENPASHALGALRLGSQKNPKDLRDGGRKLGRPAGQGAFEPRCGSARCERLHEKRRRLLSDSFRCPPPVSRRSRPRLGANTVCFPGHLPHNASYEKSPANVLAKPGTVTGPRGTQDLRFSAPPSEKPQQETRQDKKSHGAVAPSAAPTPTT